MGLQGLWNDDQYLIDKAWYTVGYMALVAPFLEIIQIICSTGFRIKAGRWGVSEGEFPRPLNMRGWASLRVSMCPFSKAKETPDQMEAAAPEESNTGGVV